MVQVSVIIPSYNQVDKIEQCVRSILSQDFSKQYEIIIVDSSPTTHQQTLVKISLLDKRITLIKLAQQTYPGAARNIGIAASKGAIIALIDSDCIADRNWLKNIDKNISDNVILTGVIQNGTKKNILGTCAHLVEFNHFLESNEAKKEVPAAATCNFACKKSVFDSIGKFTQERAFEDFLFCHKFRLAGGKIYQIQNIRISHVNKTALKDIRSNLKMLGNFSAKIRRKHGMAPNLIFSYPILAFFLVGFRYVSILSRVFKNRHLFHFLLYSPVIIYLLFYWSIGFYTGAKNKI